jgi:hypothetical protein
MLSEYLLGILKSWTAWLGVMVISMPNWWPLIADQFSGLLGSEAYDNMVRIMGILVILIRFHTTQSVLEKGKDNA